MRKESKSMIMLALLFYLWPRLRFLHQVQVAEPLLILRLIQ